jgi:predicted P-loop ATPase
MTCINNLHLIIAVAKSRKAALWIDRQTTWGKLADRLKATTRTADTLKQYASWSKDKQDAVKDVGGFVGGALRGGKRKRGHVESRQVVTLDIDYADNLEDAWIDFGLLGVAGVLYSTHKHQRGQERGRLVLPLSRPVGEEEYEAVARAVASVVGIDRFDDTTYQATRLMYWPSTSKDGEFFYRRSDGAAADPDALLASLGDWRDPSTWPRSSREEERLTSFASRGSTGAVANPEDKAGVVGAFCRVYDIAGAIEEFLPDTYAPCPELGGGRWTYAGGSTSGGLIVYDGHLAYSHHATDVAQGRLLNSFDLVRLHKFGALDEGCAPGTEPAKLPSHKAMLEFAQALKPVRRELVAASREAARGMYDDGEDSESATADAIEAAAREEWMSELETRGRKGQITPTIDNAVRILSNDARLKGRMGANTFLSRDTATGALPWDRPGLTYPRPYTDADDAELRLYLERCYNYTAKAALADAVTIAMRANAYHPVRDYLDALEWDGVERLDTLLIRCFKADDNAYTRAVTRKALCACVARVYKPGTKFDNVLTLTGEEGIGKSTVFKMLGSQWFSDSVQTIDGSTKTMEAMRGAWIIELGELSSLKRAEIETVKHFLAKSEDIYREAYGKRIDYFPRQCVFFATTNESDFLRDVNGNRRFWVVRCGNRAREYLLNEGLPAADVPQIWAEAKERLAQGEELFLPRDLDAVAQGVQDAHLEVDDRAGMVAEYLDRLLPANWRDLDIYQRRNWLQDSSNVGVEVRQRVCALEIWAECLGFEPSRITRRDSYEIARMMRAMRGWSKGQSTVTFGNIYGKQKWYYRD